MALPFPSGAAVSATSVSAESAALLALADRYYVPVYRPRRIVLERGQGSRVWDSEGRDYIDFSAGIAVNSLGHADPELVAALQTQATRLWHTSNVFVSEPPLRLAEELVAASAFAERVYLCNSGTEANEAAIKLVRKWAATAGRPPERRVILTFHGSFHGRTLAAVTATAQPKYQQGYEPLPGGFRYCDYNDLAAAEAAMAAGDVAAVLVEPVQGAGAGVNVFPANYFAAIRAICDRHDILMIADEVITGFGRLGSMFGSRHWHTKPDIMCFAKGINSGYVPLGATVVSEKVAAAWQTDHPLAAITHGYTYSGHPVACAAALANLDIVEKHDLPANAAAVGGYFLERLRELTKYPTVGQVRGVGLMLAIELVQDQERKTPFTAQQSYPKRLNQAVMSRNAQVRLNGNRFIISPPLVFTRAHVDEAMDALHQSFAATPIED